VSRVTSAREIRVTLGSIEPPPAYQAARKKINRDFGEGAMPMSMSDPTRALSPVTLAAEADSVLGGWVASHLSKHHYQISRIRFGEPCVGERVAAVILVETEAAIDTVHATLAQSMTPTLVLVSTRELAVRVLPLLEAWHDLAPATETADVIAWRLQRLIDFARRSALGMQAVDGVTGLLNRNTFEQLLRRATTSLAPGEVGGLVYIDLDWFKDINDRLGHATGDKVLKSVGRALQRTLRSGDLIGRLGGDEFACVLKRSDAESVRRDAERLLTAIATCGKLEALADASFPRLTASAGLSCFATGVEVDQLRAEADQAMYQAKSAGRNRLEIYGADADRARDSGQNPSVKHFENVARVMAERMIGTITSQGRQLLDAANEKVNICPLTGLGSRQFFKEQLPREIHSARSQGRPLSLAFIDLDQFGEINKTYGWTTGDRVLQVFAQVARDSVRSTDWIARYGGEEFAILMPDTTLEGAAQVTERLRQAFGAAAVKSFDGRQVAATLSAAVAQLPEGMESDVAFMNLASEALKIAKSSGRNRVERYRHTGTCNSAEAPPASTQTDDPFDLSRFVEAQSDLYQRFIGELRQGRKLTHCMWFMFPQLLGLGYSYESRRYGIKGLDEAVAYLAHPLLGARLRECAEALGTLDPKLSVEDVFHYPDDLKLRSSLTLFAVAAGPDSIFERLIDRFFEGTPDHITASRLGRWSAIEVEYQLCGHGRPKDLTTGPLYPAT
jgi:diguanylate cyclase (GGDEF)-like protein